MPVALDLPVSHPISSKAGSSATAVGFLLALAGYVLFEASSLAPARAMLMVCLFNYVRVQIVAYCLRAGSACDRWYL